MTEHALGAGHQRQQVEPRRVQGLGADLEQLAVDGDQLELQDVVHREPVLQAVHAAGVLGDVAADGAGDLRRRVRRVVEPMGRRASLMARLRTPGSTRAVRLSGSMSMRRLNLAKRQQHPVGQRQCTAGEPGAGAARHHRHLPGLTT
jgi:hypothetical protein